MPKATTSKRDKEPSKSYQRKRIMHIPIAVLSFLLLPLPITASAQLGASVLPSSRSVQIGSQATAFGALINVGTELATDCFIEPITQLPANFFYQTTDSTTNQTTGTPDTPVDIPAGILQTFIFGFTPTQAFESVDVELAFDCTNTDPAVTIPGVNTLLLSASSELPPDIVALAATPTNNGITDIPNTTGTGVFSAATVNVGTGTTVNVIAEAFDETTPVNIMLCETDPLTGACINPEIPTSEAVTTHIDPGATPTFGIFVQGQGDVAFDPIHNRTRVMFEDQAGIVRGATSVAIRTVAPAEPSYTAFVHSEDPRLFVIETPEGDTFSVNGTRDADGLPSAIERVFFDLADDSSFEVVFSSTERPSEFFIDGAQMLFDWVSDTQVVVTAISANETAQASMTIDLSDSLPAGGLSADNATSDTSKELSNTTSVQGSLTLKELSSPAESPALAQGQSKSPVNINVQYCGKPENDADSVRAVVITNTFGRDSKIQRFKAKRVGEGQYRAQIPLPEQDPIDVNPHCKKTVDLMNLNCDLLKASGGVTAWVRLYCPGLATAIDTALGGPSGVEGLAFGAGCIKGIRAFGAYCHISGGSVVTPKPAPSQPATSPADYICPSIQEVVNGVQAEKVTLVAHAKVGQEDEKNTKFRVPLNFDLPDFELDFGSEPKIRSLSATPSNPTTPQDVTFTADLRCLPPSTSVSFSLRTKWPSGVSNSAWQAVLEEGNHEYSVIAEPSLFKGSPPSSHRFTVELPNGTKRTKFVAF